MKGKLEAGEGPEAEEEEEGGGGGCSVATPFMLYLGFSLTNR